MSSPKDSLLSFERRLIGPASFCDVREVVATTIEAMQNIGMSTLCCSNAEIVLAEVINNIVMHAQSSHPNCWLKVSLQAQADQIFFCIQDDGVPMVLNVSNASIPDACSLPEGGWGLPIINALTQELSYQREGSVNQLQFTLPR